MSSNNNRWKEEYQSYKQGLGPTNNRNLYIDSVIRHYGSNYAKAFDKNVYELIIEDDSFFSNISSKDAAKILKSAELINKDKPCTMLRQLYKSNNKYTFQDVREIIPVYLDSTLKGIYSLSKPFEEME